MATFSQYLARAAARRLAGLKRRWDRLTLPDFARPPRNLRFPTPRLIMNSHRITLGDDCFIGPGAILTACERVGPPFSPQNFDGQIRFGDRVWATHTLQIFAAREVVIGDDVMLAGNVFISDYHHGFERTDVPYKDQVFTPVAPVRIGRGAWIGQNAVILPGVEIGEFAIIGAGSVVTRSIPARTIAAGVPAHPLKRFDEKLGRWSACPELTP